MSKELEALDYKSDDYCLMRFRRFSFLLRPLLLDFIYLMSSDESYLLDDESEYDGYNSRSSGTCPFPFHFDDSIGCVSGVGFGIFSQTGVESNCDIVTFVLFVPIGVKSKGGQLIEMFWRSNS